MAARVRQDELVLAREPLAPDFFVPDDDKPPPGVSLAAKA